MAIFNENKNNGTATYPVHSKASSGLIRRCEPIITPEQLKSRFLKGIPLKFRNGDVLTDDDLKDRIYLASNEVELLLHSSIVPEQRQDKLAYDRSLYDSYIHLKSEAGPIISLQQLAIVSANGEDIFEIPAAWIETANFAKGQINVIPLLAAYGVNQVEGAVGNAGIAFLTVLGGMQWVPAYWQIKYVYGISNKEGQVPTPVNELIGCVAAIAILSEIAPTNIFNSQSQSQDGISQSSSGPGPLLYKQRIQDLTDKQDLLTKKLRAIFFNKFFVSNI